MRVKPVSHRWSRRAPAATLGEMKIIARDGLALGLMTMTAIATFAPRASADPPADARALDEALAIVERVEAALRETDPARRAARLRRDVGGSALEWLARSRYERFPEGPLESSEVSGGMVHLRYGELCQGEACVHELHLRFERAGGRMKLTSAAVHGW
jgi:hypothetical protein